MLPSPTGCFKDKTSVFTAAAFPALESQALQGWGSGGEPPEAWKRTPEKQLPAMWIPVRGWLEGLGRGAVFHPASGLRCFGCDTSHSLTQPFLAPDGHLSKQWAGSHPASINHNAMPCQLHPPISVLPLHHLANPRHDPSPKPSLPMGQNEQDRMQGRSCHCPAGDPSNSREASALPIFALRA